MAEPPTPTEVTVIQAILIPTASITDMVARESVPITAPSISRSFGIPTGLPTMERPLTSTATTTSTRRFPIPAILTSMTTLTEKMTGRLPFLDGTVQCAEGK